MPRIEGYTAEVTVTVVLHSEQEGVVSTHSTTRKAYGNTNNHTPGTLINTATSAAVAASRIVAAGVDNAEARRLK